MFAYLYSLLIASTKVHNNFCFDNSRRLFFSHKAVGITFRTATKTDILPQFQCLKSLRLPIAGQPDFASRGKFHAIA